MNARDVTPAAKPSDKFTPRSWLGLLIIAAVIATLVWSCERMTQKDQKTHDKHVTRSDFPGTWPLAIDGGTLECSVGEIFITSGDSKYRLTGTPRPHGGSDVPITNVLMNDPVSPEKKMDLVPLITAGQKLC